MDGTEKIPQRWLQTLRRQQGDSLLLRALGAWCYFILETNLAIEDPKRQELLTLRASDAPYSQRLQALLAYLNIDRAAEPMCDTWLRLITGYGQQISSGDILEMLAGPAH